jgi:hypothetical protein
MSLFLTRDNSGRQPYGFTSHGEAYPFILYICEWMLPDSSMFFKIMWEGLFEVISPGHTQLFVLLWTHANVVFSIFLCCINCEHPTKRPKRDLGETIKKLLDPVQKVKVCFRKCSQTKIQVEMWWEIVENFFVPPKFDEYFSWNREYVTKIWIFQCWILQKKSWHS